MGPIEKDDRDTWRVLWLSVALAAFVIWLFFLVGTVTGCGPAFRAADEPTEGSAPPLAVGNPPILEASAPVEEREASAPDTGAEVSDLIDADADVWVAEVSSADAAVSDAATFQPDAPLCWSHNGSTCPPGAYVIDLPDALAPPNDPAVACYPDTTECPIGQWGSRWMCCRGACNVACGGPDAAVVACCECFRPGVACALPTDCCVGFTCIGGVCQ